MANIVLFANKIVIKFAVSGSGVKREPVHMDTFIWVRGRSKNFFKGGGGGGGGGGGEGGSVRKLYKANHLNWAICIRYIHKIFSKRRGSGPPGPSPWICSCGWLVICGLVQHGKLSVFSVYASNGTDTLQITRLGYHDQSYELRGLS